MPQRDDLAADLPPPRDDEPASLRQDIVDELADHLQCALRREQLTGAGDAAAAGERVLRKFGDPTRVARRLWWDAMREKVMTQRLMLAASIVMAAACAAMFLLGWRAVDTQQAQTAALLEQLRADSTAAAAREEVMRSALVQLEERNRTLVDQTRQAVVLADKQSRQAADFAAKSLAASEAARNDLAARLTAMDSQPKEPSDWNPVVLRLVQEAKDGPPAVGFKAELRMKVGDSGIPNVSATSDASGTVKFPRVRYGTYDLIVRAPWNENRVQRITIPPGEGYSSTIVCPPTAPMAFPASLAVEWPEDLQNRPIVTGLNFATTYRLIDTSPWGLSTEWERNFAYVSGFVPSGENLFLQSNGTLHPEFKAQELLGKPPQTPENESLIRVIQWPDAGTRFSSAYTFWIPMRKTDFATSLSLGSVKTGIELLAVESCQPKDIKWRIDETMPKRVVLLPSAEVVETLRRVFVKIDGLEPSKSDALSDFRSLSFSGRIRAGTVRLPSAWANESAPPTDADLGP